MTIFLTTHRLEEAERLCHRVAILNTTLRLIGRPDELRAAAVHRTLEVRTRASARRSRVACSTGSPVSRAGSETPSGSYMLTVADPDAAAPALARALVRAGRRHPLDRRVPSLPRRRLPGARRRGRRGEAAMSFSWARVGAILQKELRDYRRNRFVVFTMAFLPLSSSLVPMVQLFTIKVSITSAMLTPASGSPCSTC